MRILFLHVSGIDSQLSGVLRYGIYLAEKLSKENNLDVIQKSLLLCLNKESNENAFRTIFQNTSHFDLIHIQYNPKCWRDGGLLNNIEFFTRYCTIPFVVNIHDIYIQNYPSLFSSIFLSVKFLLKNLIRKLFSINQEQNSTTPYQLASAWKMLQDFSSKIFIFSEIDKKSIDTKNEEKTFIIPHFVEQRKFKFSQEEAKKLLSFEDNYVISFLGFALYRKGYDIVINAIGLLNIDCKLIFIGGREPEGRDKILIDKLIAKNNIKDKVIFTGYLSEEKIQLYLQATDIAVCPFREFSASGSLSTWISAEKPIIAHELPKIQYYNSLVSNSIITYKPNKPETLAEQIMEGFKYRNEANIANLIALKKQLSIQQMCKKYIEIYHSVIH